MERKSCLLQEMLPRLKKNHNLPFSGVFKKCTSDEKDQQWLDVISEKVQFNNL